LFIGPWLFVHFLNLFFHDANGLVHANAFTKMPLLTELEFLWERVFYKYIAPTALGFTSKPPGKCGFATQERQKIRVVFGEMQGVWGASCTAPGGLGGVTG
jgi:hypothetical protein